MIAPYSHLSDLIPVSSIEEGLSREGCTKVAHGMKHTCLWRAPNGRHFHAPNPHVYSLVPSDELTRALTRLKLVSKLPPPPTTEKKKQ